MAALQPFRATAEHFRLLAEHTSDYAIFLMDKEGRIATWNEGARRIKGYQAEEIVGAPYETLFPPEDREAGKPHDLLLRAAKDGRVLDEGWRLRKDGSRFCAKALIVALPGPGPALECFGKITSDITRSRELERERGDLYELISAANDAIIVRDMDARIRFWNHGAEVLYGYSIDEALGRVIYELLKTRYPESLESIMRAIREKGLWEGELTHSCKDGRELLVNSRWVHRRTPGSPDTILEINRDVSQTRRALELMKRAGEELETVTHAVGHDLRAPLRAIEGYAHFVVERLDGRLDEESRRMLERIPEAARRLDSLVRELVEFSDVSVPGAGARIPVSLETILDDIAAVERVPVRLARPLHQVVGDPVLVAQILSQLVSNAVKFRSPDRPPEVQVRTEARGASVRVSVKDNGVGIPRELHARVFRPFERIGESGGSGLGLTVVARAVARMGGRVGLDSEPGKGSTFWFELPGAAHA